MQTFARNLRHPTGAICRAGSRLQPSSLVAARFNHNDSTQRQTNSPGSSESRTTHFGFQTVPEDVKESLVKNVFSSVASSYDVMNDAMSMGVHRLWKDQFVSSLRPGAKGPMKCIDLAGGTGDIALRILDYAKDKHYDRETSVDVVDINPDMLKEGYRRFKRTMYHNSESVLYATQLMLTTAKLHRLHSSRRTHKSCRRINSPITLMTCIPSRLVSGIARQFPTCSRRHTAS